MSATPPTWKAGELARRTGLTVRTLHHYHETGLLSPSGRTASGHRLYGESDVARLQQILSLRALGLSLAEIRAALTEPGFSSLEVVEMHLSRVREQIALHQRLAARLEVVAAELRSAGSARAEDLIRTIEVMTMYETHYTPEQIEQFRKRDEILGEHRHRVRAVDAEWPRLVAALRAELESGTDPAAESVQLLVRRWQELVEGAVGPGSGFSVSISAVHAEPAMLEPFSKGALDHALLEYMSRALTAGKDG
jgi:DNA-binding transcriptional MerR regulator